MHHDSRIALGSSSIRDPFGSGENFELMFGELSLDIDTLLYVPRSAAPGTSIDVLRVDRTRRAAASLEQTTRVIRQQALARSPELSFQLIHLANDDAMFEMTTGDTLVPGAHHMIVRYGRTPHFDLVVMAIRKIVPLSKAGREARIRFLEQCDPANFIRPSSVAYGEFAKKAQVASLQLPARIDHLRMPDADAGCLADNHRLIVAASPFHEPDPWWILAIHHAKTCLDGGSPADLDTGRRPLELALFSLADRAGSEFFEKRLRDAVATLGKLLMLAPSGQQPELLERAAKLLRASVDRADALSADSLATEVLAGLADLLARPDEALALDARLPDPVRAALRDEAALGPCSSALRDYAWRAMRLAERGHAAIRRNAAMSLDLAAVLWGRLEQFADSQRYTAEYLRLAQEQLSVQRATFNLEEKDLADFARKQPGLFGVPGRNRPSLIYLRPMVTSNRIRLRNEFSWWPSMRDQKLRDALATLSIEAALHLAFTSTFSTHSLGGSPDLFGMARASVSKSGDTQGLAWRDHVQTMISHAAVIVVLAGESEGLLWEMSEIARQNAWWRVVLVVPPGGGSPVALRASLEKVGLDIAADELEPGFLALTLNGKVAHRFEFNELWRYKLSNEIIEWVGAWMESIRELGIAEPPSEASC